MAPVPNYLEVGLFKKFVRSTDKGGALIFFLIDNVNYLPNAQSQAFLVSFALLG